METADRRQEKVAGNSAAVRDARAPSLFDFGLLAELGRRGRSARRTRDE